MRSQRTDRSRGQSGPLQSAELEGLFERGYNLSSRRFMAEVWGLLPDDATAAEIAACINDPKVIAKRLDNISTLQRGALSQVAASGGRLRGENLRRDLLLRGFGDMTATLRELVEQGILVPLPNPGESELDIEGLIENDNFLQHDLAVPVPVEEALREEAESIGPEALGTWSGEIKKVVAPNVASLELNLLHLASLLQRESLRLNKSGAPNRRSLARFARGIAMPGEVGEASDELDLSDSQQLDYLIFLLALSLELGFAERQDLEIVGQHAVVTAFFCAEIERRNRDLLDAIQGVKGWSEVKSLELSRGRSRAQETDQFSLMENTGEPLIGARGYVFSVLRRARLVGWTPLEALIALCASLDRSYLTRTLARVQDNVEPEQYIEAVLKRSLVWMGIMELGITEDGVELARFEGRGGQAMGLTKAEPKDAAAAGAAHAGCLIVQPNFEIMLFLDAAPLEVLYFLYKIGERAKLSDRVATFKLTPESVQRGYGLGANAEGAIELLNKYSHTPVPESVAFQMKDWERVHRKLQLYAQGVLLRHADADRLDLITGQLEHELRDTDGVVVRLGPHDRFMMCEESTSLQRIIERDQALVVDYLGVVPPCLYFVDPLVVMVDPMECDLVTWNELRVIATELEDENTDRSRFFMLDAKLITRRWPTNSLLEVLAFLDERAHGGVPAGQALKLQGLLDRPARARLVKDVTVIVLESKDIADRFAEVPDVQPLIAERLGDCSFSMVAGSEAELDEILEELGIDTGDRS